MKRKDIISVEKMISEIQHCIKLKNAFFEKSIDFEECAALLMEINNLEMKLEFYNTLKHGTKKVMQPIEISAIRRNMHDTRPR